MLTKIAFFAFFSLLTYSTMARQTCDIFIQPTAFERSQASFKNISDFFGFSNGTKTFDVSLKQASETQYWTTENGKTLEQSNPITRYNGKAATLELSQNIRGEWVFRWTVKESGNAKVHEIIFQSQTGFKRAIPDFVMTENSELLMTRATTRTNPNSTVTMVSKHTMIFSKNPDGSILLTNIHTNDSIRGNRILIGDESDYRLILTER